MSVPEEALRWLEFARDDLKTAQACYALPEIAPRQTCYLAQQAAEKALKALLIAYSIQVPRSHDLDFLRNKLPPRAGMHASHPSLGELAEWVVEARYPGSSADASEEDAARALDTARSILETADAEIQTL
jgi:HEPN domain-containing protein